ncbi:MAG: hypothetical protein LBK53_05165 [Heliobacteriaceae bacterium]|jgi:hypothetical protein|nr:hypothetical protein [Heliobacteriaceae bacterium]
MIEGFDYQVFAQNLTQQALQLVPPDFDENQRNYVANTLLNFSTIAGEALYNDTESNFNLDQAVMITQIIAEWSFHKSVDLIRSELPQQFWDPIMQKIAFTIFEVAKQAFKQNIPQDQVLQLIEHHVKKTYFESVQELKDKNLIDDALMEKASNQSNIDAMMQQQAYEEPAEQIQDNSENTAPQNIQQQNMQQQSVQQQSVQPESPKVLKLATLAMLFKQMKQEKVQSILDKFDTEDAHSIIKFMGLDDLGKKIDSGTALKCLQEIKTKIPRANQSDVSPSVLIAKVKKAVGDKDRKKLEQSLQLERQKVKRFVFNAIEGEFYEIAPRVANIIAAHIAG